MNSLSLKNSAKLTDFSAQRRPKKLHFLGRRGRFRSAHPNVMGAQQPRSNCTSRAENIASRRRGVITAAAHECRVVSSKVMIKKRLETQESPCNFVET